MIKELDQAQHPNETHSETEDNRELRQSVIAGTCLRGRGSLGKAFQLAVKRGVDGGIDLGDGVGQVVDGVEDKTHLDETETG